MSLPPVENLVGRKLDRTYLIERMLNRGSMGEVYLARKLQTRELFAIKVLQRDSAMDPDLYGRFRSEARVAEVLRHPCFVKTFDFAELPDGRPYLVMEYVDGENLHSRLQRVGRIPLPEALHICRQLGMALHVAHLAGIVHRDLKPGNIILTQPDPDGLEQAKLVDFGLSRIRGALQGTQETLDGHILGTPQFMSPEAAQGLNSKLDGRSDQFSLAMVLYYMLTGKPPFVGKDLVDILHKVVYSNPPPLSLLRPDLPAHILSAMDRALAKCKVERFATTIDFVRALDGLPPLPAAHEGDGPQEFEGDDTIVDQRPPLAVELQVRALPPEAFQHLPVPERPVPPERNPRRRRTVAAALGILAGVSIAFMALCSPRAPHGPLLKGHSAAARITSPSQPAP